MFGVVYEVPVASDIPPVEAEYQLIVPALELAPNVTVPLPQRAPSVVLDILGIVLTVAVTELLVAVVQPFEVAST